MPQFRKPRARHSSKELGRRLARRAALTLLAVTLFVVCGAGFAWHNIQSRIAWFNVDNLLLNEGDRPGTKPPDSYNGRAVNLLVLGSDSRSGDNNVDGAEGETGSARSDTALVMHISADRKRIDAVSIPRDTIVDIPECKKTDGSTTESQEDGQFNDAFANGAGDSDDKKAIAYGAACTQNTVEKMTGIRIDDFVVVDFNGLKTVVDSLGGVSLYIEEPIDDENSGLQLDQGCQKLNGDQALGYARARYSIGDGSDISRIARQQQLMRAMASKALSSNVLTQSSFLTSTLETLTTSERIGQISTLSGLAYSVQDIGADKINFITMPNEAASWDENRVVPSDSAKEVWKALKEDKAVPTSATTPTADTAAPPQEGPAPTEDETTTGSESSAEAPQSSAPQADSSSQQSAPSAQPSTHTCPA